MSRLYDTYRTDKSAEASGVWYEDSGVEFLLARMGGANTKFQKAMTTALKPYMREIQLGMVDETTVEEASRKVFLDHILLDWRWTEKVEAAGDAPAATVVHAHEIPGEDDLPVKFSRAAADKLFDDLPDLYTRLREQSQSYANYRVLALQAASKN